jgi:hypothetical protein
MLCPLHAHLTSANTCPQVSCFQRFWLRFTGKQKTRQSDLPFLILILYLFWYFNSIIGPKSHSNILFVLSSSPDDLRVYFWAIWFLQWQVWHKSLYWLYVFYDNSPHYYYLCIFVSPSLSLIPISDIHKMGRFWATKDQYMMSIIKISSNDNSKESTHKNTFNPINFNRLKYPKEHVLCVILLVQTLGWECLKYS